MPGTDAWWAAPHARGRAIEGYTVQASVFAGDPLGVCVSTAPTARYEPRVYRLGWYGGAGGRLLAELPRNVGLAREVPLPDLETGIVRAGWPVTDVIRTREEWVSGQYVCVLTLTSGPDAGAAARVPFVVRGAPEERAPILVQTPVNTTQAYNSWGGKSLYTTNSTDGVAAVKVSFDRPVPAFGEANLNARAPFIYELALIRWLEREGFEIGYQTDADTHRDPFTLEGPRLIITAGHDEYWTREMRDAFDGALARGVNLMFTGANTCYWQTRYEDSERTAVVYRNARLDPESDPARTTIRFRDLTPPRPERELIGLQYEDGLGSVDDVRDYRFMPGFEADGWAEGVDLDPDRPLERLVGYEWDTLARRHPPPGCVRILSYEEGAVAADCIRWRAPSGARVLAAGSLQFAWGLDDWPNGGTADPRLQQVMHAAVRDLSA